MKKCSCLTKLTGSGRDIGRFKCEYIRLPIIGALLFFMPFILSLFLKVEICAPNIRYLLSSIAQGFAAILVLAITIPTLFAQCFSDKLFVKKWLDSELRLLQVSFNICLAVTIILPLVLLAWNNFTPMLVRLSLSLALVSTYGIIESPFAIRRRIRVVMGIFNK
jgi:hypothetical protein